MEEDKKVNEAARELSKLGAAKGGIARAHKLSPEERSEIARIAVETRWEKAGKYNNDQKILKAIYPGEIKLENIDIKIPCAVLEDGTRVLRERSVAKALGKKGSGSHWQKKRSEKGALLPEYISVKNLEPFIEDDVRDMLLNPISYKLKSGNIAQGIPATLLTEICNIWLKAREKGALTQQQLKTAYKAEILLRGFAHIGIIALVDEATGYQEVRDKLALQKILELYIAKELRPWIKTFPDEFYENLFRLKGWQYRPLSVKRPRVVGQITNNLIYRRLAPGVLDELKKVTPRDDKGRTRYRYFQRLTEDIGHPKLREHLASVTTLMKATQNWDTFYHLIQRALPQYGKTLMLPYDEKTTIETI